MAFVIFFEKPGCISNTRQKRLLEASGHRLDVRNLLTEPWTPESLGRYLSDRRVSDWFNRSAPAVKSGAIELETLATGAALAALCADPLLIRRPLMRVGERCEAGFDPARVNAWIGLADSESDVGDSCARTS